MHKTKDELQIECRERKWAELEGQITALRQIRQNAKLTSRKAENIKLPMKLEGVYYGQY